MFFIQLPNLVDALEKMALSATNTTSSSSIYEFNTESIGMYKIILVSTLNWDSIDLLTFDVYLPISVNFDIKKKKTLEGLRVGQFAYEG